jgi:hypothetical protein
MMRISVDLPAPSGGPGRPADQPRNSKSTWREVANFANTACAINQLSGNMALPREARQSNEFNALWICLGKKRLIAFQGIAEGAPKPWRTTQGRQW